MAYTTTLNVVRSAGIAVAIENELLGVGDGTSKSYDIANGNVIATSYTLSYGAIDSNDLTELTETTHYTLTKDSGLVLLTTAGATAVGSNNLYISYTHSPKASDTLIASYIPSVQKEIDVMTGNTWDTQQSTTEIFDWGSEQKYPTTDEPYVRDYDPKDEIQLRYKGIQSISGLFVLAPGSSISNVQTYDSVGTSYTDVTTAINQTGGAGTQPFASTTAAGDYLYLGSAYKFLALHTLLFTNGVTAGTNTIEYYNGTSWISISATESATGVLNFAASGKLSWSGLQDWSKTTVNGSNSLYYIRIVSDNTYSTEALLNTIYLDQDSIIQRDIPLYQLSYSEEGRVVVPFALPNGKRNIRVDYLHGYSTVPSDVQELTNVLLSIRIFAAITGGSYDDATVFSLGRKSVSIGEVYVNVRETVRQFQLRLEQLLNTVGPSISFI